MNAAQQAMVTSVNEFIVEDQPEEREEQDDVGGVDQLHLHHLHLHLHQ